MSKKDKQIRSIAFDKDTFTKAQRISRFYGFSSVAKLVNFLVEEWLKNKEVIIKES